MLLAQLAVNHTRKVPVAARLAVPDEPIRARTTQVPVVPKAVQTAQIAQPAEAVPLITRPPRRRREQTRLRLRQEQARIVRHAKTWLPRRITIRARILPHPKAPPTLPRAERVCKARRKKQTGFGKAVGPPANWSYRSEQISRFRWALDR